MSVETAPTFRCRNLDGQILFDIPPDQIVTVGRHRNADYVIENAAVARMAISFNNSDGQCVVRYERSPSSIYINGHPMLSEGQIVNPGDKIKIANVILVVEQLDL